MDEDLEVEAEELAVELLEALRRLHPDEYIAPENPRDWELGVCLDGHFNLAAGIEEAFRVLAARPKCSPSAS